jgi:hypothetical protein
MHRGIAIKLLGPMAAPVGGFRPWWTARRLFRIKPIMDGPTIVKLVPSECLALLEQAKVGRIALSVRAHHSQSPIRSRPAGPLPVRDGTG